jgi:hypothetical protein
MVNMTPKEAYHKILNEDKRISELEEIIANDALYSYCYCLNVIRGSWGLAEDTISKNPKLSYMYARDIIQGPWFKGEKSIIKDSEFSYLYARNVIKGQWLKGEDSISKNFEFSYWYATIVINEPFKKCHPYIFNSVYSERYINFLKSTNYDINKIGEWLI